MKIVSDATAKTPSMPFCVSQKSRTGAFSAVTASGSRLKLPIRSFLRFGQKFIIGTFGSRVVSAILLCCAALALHGEVYWLGPAMRGVSGKAGAAQKLAEGELDFNAVYQEPMEFNGVEMTLDVGQAPWTYEEFLRHLLLRGGRNIRLGRNGFFADYPLENGFVRRYLVIDLGNFRAVIFRMTVPDRPVAPPAWPDGLGELPAGAKVETVIRFPQRGLLYGSFSGAGPRSLSLPQLAGSLKGDGWQPVSGELDRRNAHGEIFFRDGQQLWIAADDSGNGMVCRRNESVRP